jgi:hypothetical protein
MRYQAEVSTAGDPNATAIQESRASSKVLMFVCVNGRVRYYNFSRNGGTVPSGSGSCAVFSNIASML